MSFLLEKDSLNGKAGKAFVTINGRNEEVFGLKKFQADAEFQVADFNVVGTNITQVPKRRRINFNKSSSD